MVVDSNHLLLGQWWCSAWSWVRIFDLGVNGGECMAEGSNLGLFGGQLWCNINPQYQQSQSNPTQAIDATRLVYI
jgi:hypothetical protein